MEQGHDNVENATNQKIRYTWVSISLYFHLSLLKPTLPRLHTSTTRSTAHLTHAISSKHSTLSAIPPTTSLTADDFATFTSQFSAPHSQELNPTTSIAKTPLFSICPLTEAEVSKLLLSSHPTTCPLDPIPSQLLQAISPTLLLALTHIINTSLLTGIFPHCIQAGSGNPTPQKSYIKHFTYR